jgi:AmmeMemoRadiSam system protein B
LAIIKPHAGYTYSGETAAWAYRQISPATVKRIFILGPSHHVRLRKCALTICKKYQTPLYDLKIDTGIVAELDATKEFQWMDMKTDEDEHSIEMHLPYIAKVMEDFKDQFTIIPGNTVNYHCVKFSSKINFLSSLFSAGWIFLARS